MIIHSGPKIRGAVISTAPVIRCGGWLLLAAVAACLVAVNSPAQQLNTPLATTKSASAPKLVVASRVDHTGTLAREPMAVELADGTLFVSGYGYSASINTKPNLWRSRDHGMTWQPVNAGREADGAMGNSDVDLKVGQDGTLYFVTMGYDRKAKEGTHVTVGVSKDKGATWSWTILSKNRFDDRPWVGLAPDGTAHVIWNDGSGVRHAVSEDNGVTWSVLSRIHSQGGSSHLAVGPHGEVAVRVIPYSASGFKYAEGVDLIAVSRDGGSTWQKHSAPGQRDWSPDDKNEKNIFRWVEPIAWDARGALYYLWGSPKGLWLSQSLDLGESWKSWQIVASDDTAFFPYLAVRGRGELAATWFSGWGETLQAHVAKINIREGQVPPQVIESSPFRIDCWDWQSDDHPEQAASRATGGEYLAVTFLRDGGLGVVTPIQNQREKRFGFTWWKFVAR